MQWDSTRVSMTGFRPAIGDLPQRISNAIALQTATLNSKSPRNLLGRVSGGSQPDGHARFHCCVRGDRGADGRCAGADFAGRGRLHDRRPAGQGRGGIPRAGPLRPDRLGPRPAGEAHHGQSRPGRPAEGRRRITTCPSRSGSWRPSGRSRRCAPRLHGAGRARARRLDHPGRRRASRRHGGL